MRRGPAPEGHPTEMTGPSPEERRARFAACLVAAACSLGLFVPAGTKLRAPSPLHLPTSPYPVAVDGDPREAFLLGALALPGFDPVTGSKDGRFKGYLLALPEGLYAAAQSTVLADERLQTAPVGDPGDLLLGDWVALRLGTGSGEHLFALAPGGAAAALDGGGRPAGIRGDAWAGMERRFGHTWAAEWLIPWEVVGGGPDATLRCALVRGRRTTAGGHALEVLATTSAERSCERFGAPPPEYARPSAPPREDAAHLRPLEPYEVRPFVPPALRPTACRDSVPAGEFATAWLEVSPAAGAVRLSAEGAPAPVEFFRADFWWQAGSREEQAALFPARAAVGEGDRLVAERLFPLPGGELRTGPSPVRIYARMRVPQRMPPGTERVVIRAEWSGAEEAEVPWEVRVVRALPENRVLCGLFYFGTAPEAWGADFRNMAEHGFNAVTCYASDPEEQERFVETARQSGLDGRFPMAGPPRPGGGWWGYASDEPASAEEIRRARERAVEIRKSGARPWAALCWPRSLELLPDLDAVALSPGLLAQGDSLEGGARRWVYFMGGREDPAYIRRCAAGLSRAPGLSGLWVYCYEEPARGDGEWGDTLYRSIGCRAPDAEGHFLDTVQWEALRDGLTDRRLAEAIDSAGADSSRAAPALEPARRGRYWQPEGAFPHGAVRAGLAEAWQVASP